jgi:uncharacterized repeat protein (TIGR01451 family)
MKKRFGESQVFNQKSEGTSIMRIKARNRKPIIRTVARTWITTPVVAVSFLACASPTFATIDNQATASGTYNAGTITSPQSNLVAIPVSPAAPNLSVAKSVFTVAGTALGSNNAITDGGDQIVYRYIITNNGNVTINGVVPLDAGPSFGSPQTLGTGSMSAFSIVLGTANLLPGQSVTYQATYTLSQVDIDRAAGIVVPANAVNNSATATGTPVAGTLPAIPPGTASTTITAYPLLGISKAGVLTDIPGGLNTAGNADVGEQITYTYTVANTGNVAITNVSINDVYEGTSIGAGLIIGETLSSDGPLAPGVTSTDATANDGTWSVLQPGATITFTYVHTVTQAEVNGG